MITHKRHNILWAMEHLFRSGKTHANLSHKRLMLQQEEVSKVLSQKGKVLPLCILNNPSKSEFLHHYKEYKPIVLRNMAKNWDCTQKWNFDFFQENYGDTSVPFLDTKQESTSKFVTMRLFDAIEEFKKGENTKYCKFSDLLYKIPELQGHLELKALKALMPIFRQHGTLQFFLGPKGSKTRTHNALGNNFFTQIYGSKTWYIYPLKYTALFAPPVTMTPHFMANEQSAFPYQGEFKDQLDHWKVDLKPGDILFNPSYLWHAVENHSDTIAVKLSWTSPRSFLRSPAMSLISLYNFGPGLLSLKSTLKKGDFFPKDVWF